MFDDNTVEGTTRSPGRVPACYFGAIAPGLHSKALSAVFESDTISSTADRSV